ncbi:MbcA/ParS/Xre antitoxin family protein [Methylomonas montana]|uniref:MbcA/ParS/Xre antitoxin family protein n=1 Tax=Methylomonas montana TaxID=3058963 RepID=UPI00265A514D|nr:MbcA/ParS/Xre antitoxin family protein [Methylomonas montana]WKJ90628.1 MbcA/ParS/Xre antitoxin family protein [Methylomonas montana]
MLATAKAQLPADNAMVAGAALRTFFNIADAWRLNVEQAMALLGLDSRSTYFKWKKNPETASLNADKLERLSYIFGIYKALQILLPKPEAADGWLHQPNQAMPFAGQTALQRMLSGRVADLYVVRQYLDAQCGWA